MLLQKVVSFAESAYDRLSREFDYQIKDPTPLIFYATHSAFEQNNIILNFIPEGIGAFASPVRNRMVLPVDLPDPELLQLDLARAHPHLPVPRPLRGPHVAHLPRRPATVVHGGHGVLHGARTSRPATACSCATRWSTTSSRRSPAPTSRGSSPIASATRCSISSRTAGARTASATSSTSTATPSATGSIGPSSAPSACRAEDFDLEFRRWLRKQLPAGAGRAPASRRISASPFRPLEERGRQQDDLARGLALR